MFKLYDSRKPNLTLALTTFLDESDCTSLTPELSGFVMLVFVLFSFPPCNEAFVTLPSCLVSTTVYWGLCQFTPEPLWPREYGTTPSVYFPCQPVACDSDDVFILETYQKKASFFRLFSITTLPSEEYVFFHKHRFKNKICGSGSSGLARLVRRNINIFTPHFSTRIIYSGFITGSITKWNPPRLLGSY